MLAFGFLGNYIRGMTRTRKTKRVSGLEDHLGFWLRFVSNEVSGRFRAHVEAAGVSVSEWVALRTLYDHDAMTARALIDALGMTKGAVSKVLDRLEQKGLARRTEDPDDRRAQRLALTASGRALVPRLAALADENDAHFFGHLDVETREDLARTLRALVEARGLERVPTE